MRNMDVERMLNVKRRKQTTQYNNSYLEFSVFKQFQGLEHFACDHGESVLLGQLRLGRITQQVMEKRQNNPCHFLFGRLWRGLMWQ